MQQTPYTVISPTAKIGNNVKIGPFVAIDDNVEIGDGTIIDSNVTIHSGARIGRHCHIHAGAVISDIPQDLKFRGEDTLAIIGDNTEIRECVTVHRGTASQGKTVIGDHCLIMAYCHVAHDCVVGSHVIMSNSVQMAGEVHVGDWAVLGGGALIHQFTKIGAHVMLQGGAHVNKDLPPFVMVGRLPITYEGINVVGLRRRGFSEAQIESINDVYRLIYFSKLNNSAAIEKVLAEVSQSPERDLIVDFVQSSDRGIVRCR